MILKTLLLMRHAKSRRDDPRLADHDRPLNPRGVKAARRMGRLFIEEELHFDGVLCSTSVRTRETWRLLSDVLAEAGRSLPEVSDRSDLYHADRDRILDAVAAIPEPASALLMIGHNPGLEELLEGLVGQFVRLPTAALAIVEIDVSHWADLTTSSTTRLRSVWRPRELPE